MSNSKAHVGYAIIKIGDKEERLGANFVNSDAVLDAAQSDMIGLRSIASIGSSYSYCETMFLRASNLRYKNPILAVKAGEVHYWLDGFGSYYGKYTSYFNATAINKDTARRLVYRSSGYVPIDDTDSGDDGRPLAIGGLSNSIVYNYLTESATAGFPNYKENYTAMSFVDVPGNTIGNVFKHAFDGARLMNQPGGDVALSQGEYIISGHYNPPEDKLQHRAYRIYVTKSGGTGTIVGAEKSNGETFPAATNNYTFKDATFAGFVEGDVGKYIAIRSGSHVGTFLITDYIDASTVETDAATINEEFTNETGLTWTLRTGPIAEYFWNSRPWHKYFILSGGFNDGYGTYKLIGLSYLMATRTNYDVPIDSVHDGGAFWWSLSIAAGPPHEYHLTRWLHDSPLSLDPVYANGDIVNMPLGITLWSDIGVDATKKLWLSWRGASAPASSPDQHKVLARIDPFPSGDSSIPTALNTFESQSSENDATGLCSNEPRGITCDHTNGVTWIFHGIGNRLGTTQDNGGISYTTDNGATWKRLHQLHTKTGTATVTNGSPNVSGGTAFQTEFAVGDWIRFGSDTRSYEILSITDENNLVLTENYQGTGGTYSIQKGALTAAQAVVAFATTVNTGMGTGGNDYYRAPCDYDTDGNIYWIPAAQDRLCKWSSSTGAVSEILASVMANSYAMSNDLKYLSVARLPKLPDGTSHLFDDAICIGSTASYGVIIRKADFGAGNNYYYRYHPSVATNLSAPPYRVQVVSANSNFSFLTDEAAGQIYCYTANGHIAWLLYMYPTNTIQIGQVGSLGSSPWGTDVNSQTRLGFCALRTFDKWGLSRYVFASSGHNYSYNNPPSLFVCSGAWSSFGWDGSAWNRMCVNQHATDLDFDASASGPYVPGVLILGAGLRRAMEIDVDLEFDMRLRFEQSGVVAQANEYIIDEKATWVASIGFTKDNITDMYYGVTWYTSPTVTRKGVKSVEQIKNLWSSDGGVDGGYSIAALESTLPTFSRGVAEPSQYGSYNNVASYYPNFYDTMLYINNPVDFHALAALRIKDDFELSADGSVTGGVNTLTSSGYTFVSGDIGKSIIVEGSSQGNNGQRVITSVAGSQATVDTNFVGTESSLRWKLRDIPAVGYVQFIYEETSVAMSNSCDFKLYSSTDYGQNWTKVKQALSFNGVSEGNAITVFEDDGIIFNNKNFGNEVNNPTIRRSIIFDLTGLPETDRRRQYWKIWKHMSVSSSGYARFASIVLYDDTFTLLAPPSLLMPDADDPLRVGFTERGTSLVLEDSIGLSGAKIVATDDGNGDAWTNLLTLSSGSFYVQNGSDGQTTAGATPQFVSASASFTPEMVGMLLRIPSATPVNPEDVYNGFVSILTVVDANTVTISLNLNSATGLTWQQTKFGYGDLVYFDDDTFILEQKQLFRDIYNYVQDIPTSNTILLRSDTAPLVAPLSTTGIDFYTWRSFPNNGSGNGTPGRYGISDDIGSGKYFYGYDIKFGARYFSGDTEFISLQNGTLATTPVDDDGDGRTDSITVPVDVTTGINAAANHDFIIVSGGAVGRRVFEITNIVGGASSVLTVAYDELPVSQSGLTWKIVRRRFFKEHLRESITTAQETI